MNKLVSSLAVVAALAVFVGCSDNDALTEVQNPQPIRFTVTIDNGDITRAQRITKDNFTEYQVWATNGNTKRPWLHASTIEGMFDNNVWKETSNTATWDNLTDKVNTNAFFALSADGGNMTLANAGVTLTELANNDNVDSNQEVAAEKYLDYSMPTTGSLIDLDKQVDIMAAYTSGIAKNAAVPLNFQHILSNIEIKALVTDAMWNSDTHQFDNVDDTQFPFDQDTWFYIRYIVIHGLKAEGQYKFSDGTWTTSGDAVDIKIPVDKFFYYHDLSVAANEFRAANGGTNAVVEEHRMEIEHSVYDDVVVGANSIMVIPQQVTPWDYSVLRLLLMIVVSKCSESPVLQVIQLLTKLPTKLLSAVICWLMANGEVVIIQILIIMELSIGVMNIRTKKKTVRNFPAISSCQQNLKQVRNTPSG